MFVRSLVRLLIVLLAVPSPVLAQAEKAGVVTTLEGNVSARRVAQPAPVTLKFKDDVYMRDTVTTGDKSLARMLLGGKAVVTVRERSVLTITEVPGRTSIDLDSGKFALAVAREKMRPGEEIQIRTPNAVAGVRGSVVVTEVQRQGAQAGPGVPAALTNFFVLRGSIAAQPFDPRTGQPVGTPLQIGALQSYSGAGLGAPRVQPIRPEQIGQINAGLQPTGLKSGSDTGKGDVKAQALQTAVTLVGALTGDPTAFTAITPPTPVPPATLSTSSGSVLVPPITPFEDRSGEVVTAAVTSQVVGGASFNGDFTSSSTSPFLHFSNQSLSSNGSFITIGSTGNVSLAGALAQLVNSGLVAGGSLLEILSGKFKSTASDALIALDPTVVVTLGSLIVLNGGSVTLNGPLLTDLNGLIISGGAFVEMLNGASLTGNGSGALVQLTGTLVGGGSALSGPLLSMTNSSMTLAGSLLSIVNPSSATINLGTHPMVSLRSGSSLTTGAGPFIAITGGQLTAAALLSTDGSGNVARLAGPGVTLTDVTATLGAIVHTSGSDVLALFPASNEPAVELVRTTLTVTVPGVNVTELGANVGAAPTVAGTVLVATDSTVNFSGGSLLRLKAGTFDATSPLVDLSRSTVNQTAATAPLIHVDSAGHLITMRGPLFQAAASTVNASGPLVTFENATVHSTGSGALINVTNSTITTANSGLVDFVDMMQVLDSTVSLAGPLLAVNGGSLTIGAPGSFVDDILFVDSAELTSSGSGPLIAMTNAVVSLTNIATNIFSSGVSLAGPLLAVSGGQLTTGANLFLLDTSSLTGSGSGPLIGLTNAVTSIGVAGLELFDSMMTLAGPLLAVSGGQLSMTDALLLVDLASLTSSSSGALISLTNAATSIGAEGFFFFDSTVSLGGPLLAVSGGQLTTGGHLFFLDTAGLTSSGSGALISLTNAVTSIGVDGFDFFDSGMSLAGPLLAVSGGQLTIAKNLLFAEAPATVTSSSSGALFSFTNGASVTIGLAAMHLIGVDTADELVDFFDGESFDQANMTLATDRPLQHGGTFIDADGATFTAGKGVVVDQALLAASQPLLNMRNSTATVNGDAISLINNAKVTAGISLVKLDASTLTVNGHLVSVTGGSLLTVSGDLARLANGSVLNIQGGALLNVGGNSIVKVAGGLLNFSGTGGNAVNVTNTLCGGSCSSPNSFFPNITVAGGGVVSFLDPANAIKNTGLGTLTPAANSAVLVVPAGSVVNIGQ